MKQVTLEINTGINPEDIERQLIFAAKEKAGILKEEAEVEKKLSKLHVIASDKLNAQFDSLDILIERLLPYASTKFRKVVNKVNENGRRPRTRITKDFVSQMKELSKTKRKAEIARELEVSYIVVSNALKGQYDKKVGLV